MAPDPHPPAAAGLVILMLLLLLMVAVPGCGAPEDAPVVPAGTPAATAPAAIPGTTPVIPRAGASPVPVPSHAVAPAPSAPPAPGPALQFGPWTSVEYRMNNTVTMPPNPRFQWASAVRLERETTRYAGMPAVHYTGTMTTDYAEWAGGNLVTVKDGLVEVTHRYYAADDYRFLGGNLTRRVKGITEPAESFLPVAETLREDRPGGETGIMPFDGLNITLEDRGTDRVVVPAGSWQAARNSSGTFRDGTPVIFWMVPGIPVPVQYRILNRYMDGEDPVQTYELVRWA